MDISSIRDADKVIGILNNKGINEIKLVINKYNPEKQTPSSLTIEDVNDVLNIPLLGIVYYEDNMSNIANRGDGMADKQPKRIGVNP
jgi:septum site-determining protein MinD